MYTIGAKTAQVDAFTQANPALVQTVDGEYVSLPATAVQPSRLVTTTAPRAVVTPVSTRRAAQQTRTTSVRPAPVREREVYVEEDRPTRSWQKTALIIGGSTASGAGVGAIIGGKKGALAGAAIGGGAASIYEATRRR
jgi:hypothetical protein